jgi:hypothetical protein
LRKALENQRLLMAFKIRAAMIGLKRAFDF